MRKWLVTYILFSLSLLYCSTAETADWKLISITVDGTSVLIDQGSIRHVSKGLISAWTKYEYKN